MTAPIATCEDEWSNFTDFSVSIPKSVSTPPGYNTFCHIAEDNVSGESMYDSMEDLVHKFEERIELCFKSPLKKPVIKPKNLDDIPKYQEYYDCDEIWKKLTDNYGLVQPLNWENSTIRRHYIPALDAPFNEKTNRGQLYDIIELPDDESELLRKDLNPLNVIQYNVYTENNSKPKLEHLNSIETENNSIQTADEVIQELEEIMLDADTQNAAFDSELQDQTGIIISSDYNSPNEANDDISDSEELRKRIGSVSSQDESERAVSLKKMSCSELNDEFQSLENTIKKLSQELLSELDLRDELKYVNEMRNTLISKILEVQYKQEQFHKSSDNHKGRKKFGNLTKSFSTSTAITPGRFLTTVIPVEQNIVPDVEIIQVLVKILDAIKNDSDEVPSLLTTYILKVLVPAPVNSHALNL